MRLKKIIASMLATVVLASCSVGDAFDKIMGAPTYTATVVSKHVSEDEVQLYKVTLDKFSLYNYYICPTDLSVEKPYMTVKYDKAEKQTWVVDGKEVTNHGYVFVCWKDAEASTTSEYVEPTVESVETIE